MKSNGSNTFWGQDFGNDTEDGIKTLLGFDDVLEQGGLDGDETTAREEATIIFDDNGSDGLNDRQLMFKQKLAFGGGIKIEFPTAESIERHASSHATARGPSAPSEPETDDPIPVELHTAF